jgi:glucose/arabinose dehydrogenase
VGEGSVSEMHFSSAAKAITTSAVFLCVTGLVLTAQVGASTDTRVLETTRPETTRPETTRPETTRAAASTSTAAVSTRKAADTTLPESTVPTGKGRTAPSLPTTGSTLPAAPGAYKLIASGKAEQPTVLAVRPADKSIYIAEKTGRVRPLLNGKVGPAVLDLSTVVSTTNEQGLLGLVFHPTDNTKLYVDYTDAKGNVVVSEFITNEPSAGQPISINGATQRVLLRIAKPFNEHNAGTLVFDKTGALLIGIGDGGGSGDPQNNGQRTDVLLGKVLRITPVATGGKPYGIPTDNPFAVTPGKPKLSGNQKPPRPEIFAFGLRNPWRISIDAPTGDVWVPDVGQSSVEEINRIPKGVGGQNFGWRNREGKSSYKGARPPGSVEPVFDYPHADRRCAVAGGYVYRGKLLPALVGWYLFADVCSGEVMALDPKNKWRATSLGVNLTYPTAFGEGPDGEPWLLSFEGPIARLVKR